MLGLQTYQTDIKILCRAYPAVKGGIFTELEIRGNALHISGYVNAVERESRRLPARMCSRAKSDFVEKISAGAFGRAVTRAGEVRLMFNHKRDIGGTADGTLKLSEDNIGLKAEAVVSDTDVVAAAKRGELRGWSFGFTGAKDRWEDLSDGLQRRTIDDLDLQEVSVLTVTPAYVGTSVEVRGDDVCETEFRSAEDTAKPVIVPDNNKEIAARYKAEIEILKLKGE